MCDRLHLTQVPRASINDACVSSTLTGEGRYLGPPGKRAILGARDHPQPVVGRALMRFDSLACGPLDTVTINEHHIHLPKHCTQVQFWETFLRNSILCNFLFYYISVAIYCQVMFHKFKRDFPFELLRCFYWNNCLKLNKVNSPKFRLDL